MLRRLLDILSGCHAFPPSFFSGLPIQREMADALLHVDFETFMGGTILSMNVALMYV